MQSIMLWTGRVLSALGGLFMLVDGVMKLVKPEFVRTATVELGYSEDVFVPLGIVLTACSVLYLIPGTAVLGAILLTGYLGGAVATNVHADRGALNVLLPAIFGAILWLGLFLRDQRLRAIVPWRG